MTAWIGLGSAEGVQPANGTPMLPTVETVVRWQTKANMDITLEHPIPPYSHENPSLRKKKKRDEREGGRPREMEKQKKNRKKSYKVFGLGWDDAMIDGCEYCT